jgi:hypothetical protein
MATGGTEICVVFFVSGAAGLGGIGAGAAGTAGAAGAGGSAQPDGAEPHPEAHASHPPPWLNFVFIRENSPPPCFPPESHESQPAVVNPVYTGLPQELHPPPPCFAFNLPSRLPRPEFGHSSYAPLHPAVPPPLHEPHPPIGATMAAPGAGAGAGTAAAVGGSAPAMQADVRNRTAAFTESSLLCKGPGRGSVAVSAGRRNSAAGPTNVRLGSPVPRVERGAAGIGTSER